MTEYIIKYCHQEGKKKKLTQEEWRTRDTGLAWDFYHSLCKMYDHVSISDGLEVLSRKGCEC